MSKTPMEKIFAVVLAGGKGTRMDSEVPKILHTIKGIPMIYYSLNKLQGIGLKKIYVVVGFKAKIVKKKILEKFKVRFSLQKKALGTGDALAAALKNIKETGEVLVVNGDDSAFYQDQTLKNFLKSHLDSKSVATMMVLEMSEDNLLGKVITDERGNFVKTIEAKEAKELNLSSNLINCGAYLFNISWAKENISKIPLSHKGEYYITELFNIATSQGEKVNLFKIKNKDEWVGVNTQDELTLANRLMANLTSNPR